MPKKVFDIVPLKKGKTRGRRAKSETSGRIIPRATPPPPEDFSTPETDTLSSKEEFIASLAKKEPRRKASPPKPVIVSSPPPRPRRRKWVWMVILFLLVFFGGFYGLGFLIARADVSLRTQKQFQPFTFDVTLKQSPKAQELSQGVLSLERVQKKITLSREYPTTGEGAVVSKAHGKVLVFNAYSTHSQTFVSKTRFVSPDGKVFRTPKAITVPGGKMVGGKLEPGSVEGDVIADAAGPQYNIDPTQFTLPGLQGTALAEKFYAISQEKFVGGAEGKSKIVKAEDITKGKEEVSRLAFESLRSDISQSIPENVRFLPQASQIRVIKIDSTAKAGDGAEKFKVTIDAQITALIFDELAIKDVRVKRSPAPPGNEFVKPVFDVSYEILKSDFDAGALTLRVNGSKNIGKGLDILALKQALKGKNAEEVKRTLLTLEGVEEAKISFWPFWARRIPRHVDRIQVHLI